MATTYEEGTAFSWRMQTFVFFNIIFNPFLQFIFPLTFLNAIGKYQKFNQFMTISIHFRSKWCGNFPLSAGKFYFQENLWESSSDFVGLTKAGRQQYKSYLPSKQKIHKPLSNDIFVLGTLYKYKHCHHKLILLKQITIDIEQIEVLTIYTGFLNKPSLFCLVYTSLTLLGY